MFFQLICEVHLLCSITMIVHIFLPCHRYLCLCVCTDTCNKVKLMECLIVVYLFFSSHFEVNTCFMFDPVFFILATVSSSSLNTCPYLAQIAIIFEQTFDACIRVAHCQGMFVHARTVSSFSTVCLYKTVDFEGVKDKPVSSSNASEKKKWLQASS